MDQASASLAASCARNPAVPKTSPSWRLSEDQSQIVVPPRDGLAPQSEPHCEPVHIAPRPSSPALCRSNAKGYLLPDFYSGCATGIPGRFSDGLLLRRVHCYAGRAHVLLGRPQPGLRYARPEDVGRVLLEENVRSVLYRYGGRLGDDEKQAADSYCFAYAPRPRSPVQIIKAVHCLDYQSCETEDWETTLAWRICQALLSSTTARLPGYEAAAWEIVD